MPVFEVKDRAHPENSVCLLVKPVVTKLILYIKQDQEATGYADSQTGNI
jgi:hypothetical protein